MAEKVDHFAGDQLYLSDTAERHGVDNTPPPEIRRFMETRLKPFLEDCRIVLLNRPMLPSSGYRNDDVNCLIGGACSRITLQTLMNESVYEVVRDMAARRLRLGKIQGNDSSHTRGGALDFTCPGFGTAYEVSKALSESGLPIDQVIYEYGRWCHVSTSEHPRHMVLTIKRGWTRYQEGILA